MASVLGSVTWSEHVSRFSNGVSTVVIVWDAWCAAFCREMVIKVWGAKSTNCGVMPEPELIAAKKKEAGGYSLNGILTTSSSLIKNQSESCRCVWLRSWFFCEHLSKRTLKSNLKIIMKWKVKFMWLIFTVFFSSCFSFYLLQSYPMHISMISSGYVISIYQVLYSWEHPFECIGCFHCRCRDPIYPQFCDKINKERFRFILWNI